ncbi:uncharacterized protein LOC130896066 [Diorhabda carinulata]|uniref:uncharacterized protein LOC130896066 n=1 Tax=Diorhabda carinulata TaxID=1163345 RepID=UPI0025A27731|nr:uncharacterized protein LOC130896066 [Diorhabda carinulata]
MSLIIRRVENISRKKRKTKSKLPLRKDVLEDDASKFVVIEDFYLENFPPLRPVYRKDIFGTPIVFRATTGVDFIGDVKSNVLIHCITFMREYKDKSYEELRWEDYICGRKEVLHYEENSYLKSLYVKQDTENYEFFDPVPKNVPVDSTKQNTSSVTLSRSLYSLVKSSKSYDQLFDTNNKYLLLITSNSKEPIKCTTDDKVNMKESRPRSILTNVHNCQNKNRSSTKSSTDVHIQNVHRKSNSSRQEHIEMMRNNLLRYFERAEPGAHMPYDLIMYNPKFYLPCAEIGFVYKNARPSKTIEKKLIVNNDTKSSYVKRNSCTIEDSFDWKYTCDGSFNKIYFWKNFDPYNRIKSERTTRAKYILVGLDITRYSTIKN